MSKTSIGPTVRHPLASDVGQGSKGIFRIVNEPTACEDPYFSTSIIVSKLVLKL